jgi:hypothetical protein
MKLQGNGEDYVTRSFLICTQYYSGDRFKKNEMGGTCNMYGGEERCYRVSVGKSDLKRPLRRLGVYERIILE